MIVWMRACVVFFALIACAAAPALAAPSRDDIAALVEASRLDIETFDLKNGMQVVVIPDHRVPVATLMVWYKIGSADEVQGKSGLAHFLEHLMFKGTRKIQPGEFSKIVARNGGQDNAFTTWDYTAYYERVAKDRLKLMMEIDADRARHLRLTDAIVYPERDVIIEERRQRIDNRPESLLSEQMDAALYENSRYGVPIIGWLREMQTLTTEDALAWYRTYYAPNNAILIVAGDVAAEELKPLAEKTYGRLRRAKTPARKRALEPKQSAERRVKVVDARAEQPVLVRTYHAPNESNPDTAAALDVAARILGGSATSRLYRSLVVDKGLAASASAGYWSTRLEEGELTVQAIPRPGVSLAALEKAVDQVIAEFVNAPPAEEDVHNAQFNLIAERAYSRDSQEELANEIGTRLATGETIEQIQGWPGRIAAVTPQGAQQATRAVLRMDQSVTGILVPKENGL